MKEGEFQSCIAACAACAEACEKCSDACIDHPEMANCVRACRDCAQLCLMCLTYMCRSSRLAAELCSVLRQGMLPLRGGMLTA